MPETWINYTLNEIKQILAEKHNVDISRVSISDDLSLELNGDGYTIDVSDDVFILRVKDL